MRDLKAVQEAEIKEMDAMLKEQVVLVQ